MAIQLVDLEKELLALPLEPDKVPYSFNIKLTDRTYTFTIKYNYFGEFFTVDLFTVSGEPLCYGDPIRYGRPLFSPMEDERFPIPVIIPLAVGKTESEVTKDNLGQSVHLFFFPREGFEGGESS